MRTAFLLAFLLCCQILCAQVSPKGSLSTRLTDEAGEPVAAQHVSLTNMADSSKVLYQLSDTTGLVLFENLSEGWYRLGISGISYFAHTADSLHISSGEEKNLGTIVLVTESNEMGEIIVTAQKPLYEDNDGVLTMNVSASAEANTSSAGELIRNMPMMATDPDGKILMKGKEPRILIDDKPTGMNAQQLADLLESLPGSAIEKIEMMMNPPPEYASEEGGVINIITRKGKIGFTGRLNSFYGTRGEASLNGNLSYRDKKWSVDFIAGASYHNNIGRNSSVRENRFTDSSNQLVNSGRFNNEQWRPHYRLSADYAFNERHQVNLVTQVQRPDHENFSINEYRNLNRFDETFRLSNRSTVSDGTNATRSVTGSYIYKGKKSGRQLRLIAGHTDGSVVQNRLFTQTFLSPKEEIPTGPDSLQNQFTDNHTRNTNIRLNYSHPSGWKPLSFSAGFTGMFTRSNNLLEAGYTSRIDGSQKNLPELGNHFDFFQSVIGYRGSLIFRLEKKWSITTGTTVEQTANRFAFHSGNGQNTRNRYDNLLPQATLRKTWTKNRTASFSYRKTVRRPGIQQLNPSINNFDPYNIRFGNPFLSPAVSDNFDLTLSKYKGKSYVNGSIGFNKVKDIFQQIRTLVDERTEISYQNLSGRTEYEAGLWGGYAITKDFRLNGSIHYLYSHYINSPLMRVQYRDGGSLNTSINWTCTLNPLLLLQGAVRYHSFADPQGSSRANLSTQFGIQQKLMNKRLYVSAMITDPFNQQQFTTVTYGEKFQLTNQRYTRTQNLRVGLAYNLTPAKKETSKKEIMQAVQEVKKK